MWTQHGPASFVRLAAVSQTLFKGPAADSFLPSQSLWLMVSVYFHIIQSQVTAVVALCKLSDFLISIKATNINNGLYKAFM